MIRPSCSRHRVRRCASRPSLAKAAAEPSGRATNIRTERPRGRAAGAAHLRQTEADRHVELTYAKRVRQWGALHLRGAYVSTHECCQRNVIAMAVAELTLRPVAERVTGAAISAPVGVRGKEARTPSSPDSRYESISYRGAGMRARAIARGHQAGRRDPLLRRTAKMRGRLSEARRAGAVVRAGVRRRTAGRAGTCSHTRRRAPCSARTRRRSRRSRRSPSHRAWST